jgi:hypothetical protein
VSFGRQVLSHPLLVEAIETEFVPVAIHNNRPGKDADALKRFGEPAWNNPVVRFLDARGEDLLPRKDGVFAPHAIAARLIGALEAASRPVPGYLRLAAEELEPRRLDRAAFAMHCFWEGEGRLGALDGVASTRAGFLDGREVVEVRYDPARLSAESLVRQAQEMNCAAAVHLPAGPALEKARAILGERARALEGEPRDAPQSDQKHALRASFLRWVPVTPHQAMKINSALQTGRDPAAFLSPRQTVLARRIEAVVRSRASALEGLERPETVDALAAYEAALRRRLP